MAPSVLRAGALVLVGSASIFACSSSGGGATGAGGATSGSHASSTSASTSSASTASHASSAASTTSATSSVAATTGSSSGCQGMLDFGATCNACMDAHCCAEEMACSADAGCVQCLTMVTQQCATGAAFSALAQCLQKGCPKDCEPIAPPSPACDAPVDSPSKGTCIAIGGSIKCNPFTNEGCDAQKQEICDSGGKGAFACFPPPPPSSQDLCQDCSSQLGFCKSGATCIGTCFKLCCDDGDCGSGHCDKSHAQYLPAGVCAK